MRRCPYKRGHHEKDPWHSNPCGEVWVHFYYNLSIYKMCETLMNKSLKKEVFYFKGSIEKNQKDDIIYR